MIIKKLKTHFDAVTHQYVDDEGNQLPSVSKVIGTAKHFGFLPKDKQEEVMARGSILHQDVDFYLDTGDTMGSKLLESFAKVFDRITRDYGKLVAHEIALAAAIDDMKYGGKPDILIEGAVIEIKSSLSQSSERLYAQQLQAYNYLAVANELCSPEEHIICYKYKDEFNYKVIKKAYGGIEVKDAFLWSLRKYYADFYLYQYNNNL